MKYFLSKYFESLYLGFLWGLLGLLFFSCLFFFYQIYESRVDRITFEEKTQWNSILNDYASYLKDAETGVRGYLLTGGDPNFLEPYSNSLNQMRNAEEFLRAKCEPSYESDLDSIIRAKQLKLDWIQNFIENFPAKRPQIGEFIESKRRMDLFRSEVQSLLKKKSEKESLDREKSRKYTIRLITISGGLFFILSIFIIWMIFVLKRNAQIILEKELIEDRLF